MTTALLSPQPLPLERMRPGVGLLVLAFHLAMLWVANLYWPLQSVLLGSVQAVAHSITVQIIQKTAQPSKPSDAAAAAMNTNSQAISNAGRQRFGRAEPMLQLPDSQTESTTPLAATQQAVQTARAAQNLPTRSAVVAAPKPAPEVQTKPTIDVAVQPAPQAVAAPDLSQTVAAPAPLPPVSALPPSPPLPAAAIAAPTASAPVAAAQAPAVAPTTVVSSPVSAVNTASNPGITTATTSALGSSAGTAGTGSAAAPAMPSTMSPGAGAPLNLNLPPRSVYRPPIFVPRRSLSELANEQLRRKPRDAFAEGIESAGNIDCLKDAPDGPAQGLLAIGPLLKRAIEEKCRK